jgi:hypothetical protein
MTISNCCQDETSLQHCSDHAHANNNAKEERNCCTHNVYMFAPEMFSFQDISIPSLISDFVIFKILVPETTLIHISQVIQTTANSYSQPLYIINRLLRL